MITKHYVIELFIDSEDSKPRFRQVVECEEKFIRSIADDLKKRLICSRVVVRELV